MSKIERNKEILKSVLAGDSYAVCAERYSVSLSTVSTSIRLLIGKLKEHTDLPVEVTSNREYLLENKEIIENYMNYALPKTHLTQFSRSLLKDLFGKYYASEPAKVAENWTNLLEKRLRGYPRYRDRKSIEKWLVSEGFLVPGVVTKEMVLFVLDTVKEKIAGLKKQKGDYACHVKDIEQDDSTFIASIEVRYKEHVVLKQFSFELFSELP